MELSQNECESEISVPGAFKLDHLQPVEPILFCKFSNYLTFILEANSYYPREGKNKTGKMEFSQPECESGITVPGAFKLDHLQPVEPILFFHGKMAFSQPENVRMVTLYVVRSFGIWHFSLNQSTSKMLTCFGHGY